MQTSSSCQTTGEPAFFGSFFQKACVSLRPSSSVSSTAGKPIPHTFCSFPGWGFSMGTNYHFHSWRVFVIVCALPCTLSLVALKFMPESPRFLLEVSVQRLREPWPWSLSPQLRVLSPSLTRLPLFITLLIAKSGALPLGDSDRPGVEAHGETGGDSLSG